MTIMIALIIASVFLATVGQILLKIGMDQVGYFAFNMHNAIPIAFKIAMNIPVVTGITVYVISLVMWLMVLSRTDVSYAYPMVSMGYLFNLLAAHYILGETISATRILGTCIIIVGVILVAKSGA